MKREIKTLRFFISASIIVSSIRPVLSLEIAQDFGAKIEPINLIMPIPNQSGGLELNANSLVPDDLSAQPTTLSDVSALLPEKLDSPVTIAEGDEKNEVKPQISIEENPQEKEMVFKTLKRLGKIFRKIPHRGDAKTRGMLGRFFDSSQSPKRDTEIKPMPSVQSSSMENVQKLNYVRMKLHSRSKETQVKAARMLPMLAQSLRPDQSTNLIEIIFLALNHADFRVRYSAIEALSRFVDVAKNSSQLDVLRLTEKAASDSGWYQKSRLISDLPKFAKFLGPQYHPELMKIIKKLAEDQDNVVRHSTIRALPQLLQIMGPSYQLEMMNLVPQALAPWKIDSREYVRGKKNSFVGDVLSYWIPLLEARPLEDMESFYWAASNSPEAKKILEPIIEKRRLEEMMTQGKVELPDSKKDGTVALPQRYGNLLGYSMGPQ